MTRDRFGSSGVSDFETYGIPTIFEPMPFAYMYVDGMNLFQYAISNPMQYVDFYGLWLEDLWCKDQCSPGTFKCKKIKLKVSMMAGGLELGSIEDEGCDGIDNIDTLDYKKLHKKLGTSIALIGGYFGSSFAIGLGFQFEVEMNYDCCSHTEDCFCAGIISGGKCWYWDWEGKFTKTKTIKTNSNDPTDLDSDNHGGLVTGDLDFRALINSARSQLSRAASGDCRKKAAAAARK